MQLGWSVTWKNPDGTTTKECYDFDTLIEWSKSYPDDFDYTPGMLMHIRDSNATPRNFISPSMLSGCPRQAMLVRLHDFYATLKTQWAMYRGTLAHTMLEGEWREKTSVIEKQVSADIKLAGGRFLNIRGTPDKYVTTEDGETILIDYKTVSELHNTPKDGWTAQVNAYVWMLAKNKIFVTRAFIQQIGMQAPRRVPIEIWPLEKTEAYIAGRAEKFLGVLDPKNSPLPPMLDPVLDAGQVWLCSHPDNWCPVRELCWKIHDKEVKKTNEQ